MVSILEAFFKNKQENPKRAVSEARTEASPYPFCSCVNVSKVRGEISHRNTIRCDQGLAPKRLPYQRMAFIPPVPLLAPRGDSRPKPLKEGWRELRPWLPLTRGRQKGWKHLQTDPDPGESLGHRLRARRYWGHWDPQRGLLPPRPKGRDRPRPPRC